ncbi:MAG: BamA/TamA family outer membrane protein [Flavobacteriales bacterium]
MPRNLSKYLSYFLICLILFTTHSCKSKKGLDAGFSILVQNDIYINGKLNNDEILHTYLKQQPKSKYFGLKREQILFSERKLKQSAKQLKLYYNNKSYFNNTVKTIVKTKKNKTKVEYHIQLGQPYNIDTISYSGVKDESIKKLIKENLNVNETVKVGLPYDYWALENKRNDIYGLLIENGYYSLEKSDLGFYADTINKQNSIGLEYFLKTKDSNIKPFRFNQTVVKLLTHSKKEVVTDTLTIGDLTIIAPTNTFPITTKTLKSCLLFTKGDLFKRSLVDNSYSKLNNLNVFERIRVTLNPDDENNLDCVIEMYTRKKIVNTYSVEGVHTSGNYGLAGTISYEDRNIFKGAESLKFKLNGIAEHQGAQDGTTPIFNAFTVGGDLSLTFPKLLSPVNTKPLLDPSRQVNTTFSLGYNRLNRPSLGRTILNFKYGYHWQIGQNKHYFNPVEISSVYIDEGSDLEGTSGTNIQQLYTNFLITASNYTFEFTDQNPKKIKDHNFLRAKIESSGNIFSAIAKTTNFFKQDAEGRNLLYNNVYTQYLKFDFDYRHYFVFNKNHEIATRFQFGIGVPYGNSSAMPFQKQYFIGGSNDIRGFDSYSTGPGSYPGNSDAAFYTADMKIQSSLEYRFTIYESFKGAAFVDAGNIWEVKENKDEDGNLLKPGAHFKWNRFHEEIASSIGIGLRYDMDFLLFRVDFSHPMYDPSVGYRNPNYNKDISGSQEFLSSPISQRWQLNNITLKELKIGIGIGYPF